MTEPQAQIYEFGDFRMDTAKRMLCKRDDQAVALTAKAFDALLYLVEHRAVELKKEELMSAIWPGRVVEENNLNQIISTLRRTLGEAKGEHRYILTIPGRGYRFVAELHTDAMRTGSPAPTVAAIAVLPFMPLVAEHRDMALELGMADTLSARLSGIRELVVRPISSVRRYATLDQNPLAAGRELAVESILEGSIQRWGDTIRVTVRLMQVATGAALWTGTFDEKFSNIFAVQDAIAERVVAALALQLGHAKLQHLSRRRTDNAEVYELYLKGRFHLFRLTPPEMQTGIGYFQQAIAIDPEYALAHIGLANAMFRMPLAGEVRPGDFYPGSKAAAQKALELDNTLAEGHAILGWIAFWYEWNWVAAENHFRQALKFDPNDAESHLGYAHFLSNTGRHREALAEVKRSRELNPLHLLGNALEGLFLIQAGRLDEAQLSLHKTLALDARFWFTHLYYSALYFEQGRFAEALDSATQAETFSGGNSMSKAVSGIALVKLGRAKEARAILKELLQASTQRYIPPYHFALLYNILGEQEKTLASLEQGIEDRDPKMTFLQVDPRWKNLRKSAGFEDIVRRVGLSPTPAGLAG
jgi:DNA-binding winged helix-turn-helix (wHTH) protein/tetratricopeptide (TPR) repeat protein